MNRRLIPLLMWAMPFVAGQEAVPYTFRGPYIVEAADVYLPGAVAAQVAVQPVEAEVFAGGAVVAVVE